MTEPVRTPAQWLAVTHPHTIILDCDGWTRAEWLAQQPTTRAEFERRLLECTIGPAPGGQR